MRAPFLDRGDVAREHAFAAQWSEAAQLKLADPATGVRERQEGFFVRERLVERDQFVAFALARMKISAVNRRPFVRNEYVALVVNEKFGERLESRRRREAVRSVCFA